MGWLLFPIPITEFNPSMQFAGSTSPLWAKFPNSIQNDAPALPLIEKGIISSKTTMRLAGKLLGSGAEGYSSKT
jgi:hypothetical protein